MPKLGLIVRYDYIWSWQDKQRQKEADYPRPCIITSAVPNEDKTDYEVRLAPLTRTTQEDPQKALALKWDMQRKLMLPERSWVKLDESNRIPQWSKTDDLKPIDAAADPQNATYGQVDREFFSMVAHGVHYNRQFAHYKSVTREHFDPDDPKNRKFRMERRDE